MTLSLVAVWTSAVMEVEVTSITAVSMKNHILLELLGYHTFVTKKE